MTQFPKCLPCYLNACVNAMTNAGISSREQQTAICELAKRLDELPPEGTPCENASSLLHMLYDMLSLTDPFKAEKSQCNKLAAAHLINFSKMVSAAEDPLYMALKLAAAGNVIDLAVFSSVDVGAAVRESLKEDFFSDDYKAFKESLPSVQSVLIAGDNAGEIVLDTILVNHLISMGKKVTYLVKDGPMVNDVTMEDANFCGLSDICEVKTTGRADMGYSVSQCPDEVTQMIKSHDIVISKGQANFEGFDGVEFLNGRIFFLFKVKCSCISEYVGVPEGRLVFMRKE